MLDIFLIFIMCSMVLGFATAMIIFINIVFGVMCAELLEKREQSLLLLSIAI